MEIIQLPFPCFVYNINFKETLTLSEGVKLVAFKGAMHNQFSMTIGLSLLESSFASVGLLLKLLK